MNSLGISMPLVVSMPLGALMPGWPGLGHASQPHTQPPPPLLHASDLQDESPAPCSPPPPPGLPPNHVAPPGSTNTPHLLWECPEALARIDQALQLI